MIKVSTSITAVKAEPVCEDMLQHTYVENNHLVYSLSLNEQSILDISLERSVSILPSERECVFHVPARVS